MNKRLRKKKHKGEFQQLGFQVGFRLNGTISPEDQFELLDRFVDEVVESSDSYYGGGLDEGFVDTRKLGLAAQKCQHRVEEWAKIQPEINFYYIGPLVDAWYGPFEEGIPEDGWTSKA